MQLQTAPLYLYNTLTRRKERFASREPGRVKMFTCGPSIYSWPHVGNYRTFLFEDLLQRYLEYLGYRVERVINFTDVEDKSVDEASRQGLSLADLTEPVAECFRKEAALLAIDLPEFIPRSSTSVEEAVRLIRILLEKGYAYWHEGDVFFDPLKYEGFGKLFGLDMSRWPKKKRRFRKDTYPGQRCRKFANYWLHGGHVLVGGVKMSKSRGNIIYPEDLLAKGLTPRQLRFSLIYDHYREKIDLKKGHLAESGAKLDRLHRLIDALNRPAGTKAHSSEAAPQLGRLREIFEERLSDDLDVSGAVEGLEKVLEELVAAKKHNGWREEEARQLRRELQRIDGVLQVLLPAEGEVITAAAGLRKRDRPL
ncbi:MAG: class I tRNA ligase family protein [Deltaproteobacteria bacterium]